jgi:hypothetical protein
MTPLEAAHEIHQRAMELAESAFLSERRGDHEEARKAYYSAFQEERAAASALAQSFDIEPTRSVFYRSAATLALRCGEIVAAERLAAQGLAGDAPREIADELRDLLEEVSFARHLQVKGIVLSPDSFQISLWGGAVSPGRVAGHEFSARYQDTERLVYRTAERKLKRPFRENLSSTKAFRKNLEVYVSTPRAASFAVTVSVGVGEQAYIPEFQERSPGSVVVQELLGCVQLFDERKDEELKARIGSDAYYYNFIGLMSRIAPDGNNIRGVGFTSSTGDEAISFRLTRRQDELPIIGRRKPGKRKRDDDGEELEEVRGVLDIQKGITIHGDDGSSLKVIVPEGLMGDVVRPLWEHRVLIRGRRRGKTIVMAGIQEADE